MGLDYSEKQQYNFLILINVDILRVYLSQSCTYRDNAVCGNLISVESWSNRHFY